MNVVYAGPRMILPGLLFTWVLVLMALEFWGKLTSAGGHLAIFICLAAATAAQGLFRSLPLQNTVAVLGILGLVGAGSSFLVDLVVANSSVVPADKRVAFGGATTWMLSGLMFIAALISARGLTRVMLRPLLKKSLIPGLWSLGGTALLTVLILFAAPVGINNFLAQQSSALLVLGVSVTVLIALIMAIPYMLEKKPSCSNSPGNVSRSGDREFLFVWTALAMTSLSAGSRPVLAIVAIFLLAFPGLRSLTICDRLE
jgi:hypothetical protein